LVRGRRAPAARWGWLIPPLLRGTEYLAVVAAAAVSGAGVGAACYAYLLAVIWHFYDSFYRLRRGTQGAAMSPVTLAAGFELRTVALLAAAAAGATAFKVTAWALAGILAVLGTTQGWTRWRRSRLVSVPPEGDGGPP